MLDLKREEIEIMSPVGSFETLVAAIQGGADAVYFGIGTLNMRSRSTINFTLGDLEEIVRVTREHGVKTYMTINTVVYDNEIAEMKKLVDAAKKHDIDAIIASDQSVLLYAREKGVEIHLSTQVNISNVEALRFYANFADVVVLARELNLTQVKHIFDTIEKEQIKGPSGNLIKIELFSHGALCMAISGKCYLSLHEFNYPANRGQCLQTCRRGYEVKDLETGYKLEVDNEFIMSPKDLKTIHFLNKIIDAGVRVLKIEGRARPPEYVKTVTRCYNEAVDAIIKGTYTLEKIKIWNNQLNTVFNRGFWDGYYLGQKLGEWNRDYGSKASKKKTYVAKTTNYFSKLGVGEFLIESGSLSIGDEILIIGPSTGVIEMTVREIRVAYKNVETAGKGESLSLPVPSQVRRADKLFKLVSTGEIN